MTTSIDRSTVFSEIYKENKWGCPETKSGVGSTFFMTALIRERLPLLLKWLKVKSVLDLPCGDFNWMLYISMDDIKYIGADIVTSIIEINNNSGWANKNRVFTELDGCCDELPKMDLILCRDLVVHLPNDDILTLLRNFVSSGSKYLLLTRFLIQYGHKPVNANIQLGDFRAVDICSTPFEFPLPILSLPESQGPFKTLALWDLNTIASHLKM